MKSMDHWDRLQAAINGDEADHPPIAFWKHFPEDDMHVMELVRHTVEWQRKWEFDLVKFMPPGTFSAEAWGSVSAFESAQNGARVIIEPAVRQYGDWAQIKPVSARRGAFGRQNEALAYAARFLRGSVPILQTVFSPLATARKMSSDRLYADLRCAPDAVEQALEAITETTIEFALAALEAGAHGVFLATQQASNRILTEAEYERFGKKYDLMVLDAIRDKARFNMLHAHGEDIMVSLLSAYPVHMVNWHDRLTYPSLAQAVDTLPGLLVGGVDELRTLLYGSDEDIALEIRDALEQTGGRRLMLAPGCVLHTATPDRAIAAAIAAVRSPEHQALCA